MCDKYLAPRFTPHLVKYVMPVYTFASRDRICGQNDLGESAVAGAQKNPVNTGYKFLKHGKHWTKISRRCFTHRGGTCNAPFIVLPLVGRSARSAGKSPSWAGAKVTYRSEDEEWREVGDFWGFSRRRKSQKSTTSRHLFIWGSFARGESKPCRSSTLSRDLFTLTD